MSPLDGEAGEIAARLALARALPGQSATSSRLLIAATLLLTRHLRFDAADPLWADRDRLVFGGETATLAGAWAQLLAPGAPECRDHAHVVRDGRLALGTAVGLAYAERLLAARHGGSLVDHRVWLFAADPDIAGGMAQEAASAAGELHLGRLTAIVAAGDAGVSRLSAFAVKGWSVRQVDACSAEAVGGALSAAMRSRRPSLILCLGEADAQTGGDACASVWAEQGRRGAAVRRGWLKRVARHSGRQEFERAQAGRMPAKWHDLLAEPTSPASPLPASPLPGADASTAAVLSGALLRVAGALPEVVALAAHDPVAPRAAGEPRARLDCLNWDQQLQAMGTALFGMALHGGLIPIGRCRLADAEALLPALRLAASSGLRVIQVLSEPDDPHEAWGRRAALRAIRGLFVFRPADATEAGECAELALRRRDGPSVLLLSGMPVAPLADRPARTRCARGGYVLRESETPRAVTLLASGPDIAVALAVRDSLGASGIVAAVISLPCWTLFAQQDDEWRRAVLGTAPLIALEAGSGFGWERWTGTEGLFVSTCGTSADGIATMIRGRLEKATLRKFADLDISPNFLENPSAGV